ncbi:hypothetical protein [Rosistilla oblonga]|uniref:Uncharacterized protein n=1 Tax=Rosistilla oblonga TaxID=2527990 RepID=A0A518J1D4_9BACT|nr:hypothetical protein [Rosistilla oblonga]QDV59150.1 hypothetical protein Mal33_51780 [Rosistilla oblonga]
MTTSTTEATATHLPEHRFDRSTLRQLTFEEGEEFPNLRVHTNDKGLSRASS